MDNPSQNLREVSCPVAYLLSPFLSFDQSRHKIWLLECYIVTNESHGKLMSSERLLSNLRSQSCLKTLSESPYTRADEDSHKCTIAQSFLARLESLFVALMCPIKPPERAGTNGRGLVEKKEAESHCSSIDGMVVVTRLKGVHDESSLVHQRVSVLPQVLMRSLCSIPIDDSFIVLGQLLLAS